jgi:hypothetical protein
MASNPDPRIVNPAGFGKVILRSKYSFVRMSAFGEA